MVQEGVRSELRKYSPVYQSGRKQSILDDLKYLPPTYPSDHPPSMSTSPDDVTTSPGTHPTDDFSERSTTSPSEGLTTSPTAPTGLLESSPVPQNHPPQIAPSSQILNPDSLQPPHMDLEDPPVQLRRSTRMRRPPKWQTSDDIVLF